MAFVQAEKKKLWARLAIDGPSGGGKTFTALRIARALAAAAGGEIAVIDSERKSASKYSDIFTFQVSELDDHKMETYIREINVARAAGFPVLLIDSLSHAWMGEGGALELVDAVTAASRSGNSFVAWGSVTPVHNQLLAAILTYPGHVIVTMRSKMAYAMEEGEGRKSAPKKVGMEPEQRKGIEYEFDIVLSMDHNNVGRVTKSRCVALKGYEQKEPGEAFGEVYLEWLGAGKDILAEIQQRAASCDSVEVLSKLKAELQARGGDYYNAQVKEILMARHAKLTALQPTGSPDHLQGAGAQPAAASTTAEVAAAPETFEGSIVQIEDHPDAAMAKKGWRQIVLEDGRVLETKKAELVVKARGFLNTNDIVLLETVIEGPQQVLLSLAHKEFG
jgi:KaiC/GvpD/RAD55 family RecA-like ATPase